MQDVDSMYGVAILIYCVVAIVPALCDHLFSEAIVLAPWLVHSMMQLSSSDMVMWAAPTSAVQHTNNLKSIVTCICSGHGLHSWEI